MLFITGAITSRPGARKVSASCKRGEAVFLTEEPVDEETLSKAIDDTGYHYLGYSEVPYEKCGLFGKKK